MIFFFNFVCSDTSFEVPVPHNRSKDTLTSEPTTKMEQEFNHLFQQKQLATVATAAGAASKEGKVCLVRGKQCLSQEKRNTLEMTILLLCSLTYPKGNCL